jgi:acylphosphatase
MTAAARKAFRIVVRGRVQGVGFRAFLARGARDLGLHGWTRNCRRDEVETLVAGEAGALSEFRELARRGPFGARVDDYLEESVDADALYPGFAIAPSV